MKLRLRGNSIRLRVNRQEVERLASGKVLEEEVRFPGNTRISYVLEPSDRDSPTASFDDGAIRIAAPRQQVREWANTESIGIYFELPSNHVPLSVAIEKDLECLDAPEQERDPDAFPRVGKNC